jgi:hypothetical protein
MFSAVCRPECKQPFLPSWAKYKGVTSGLSGWAIQGFCWLSSHLDVPDPTRPPLNRKPMSFGAIFFAGAVSALFSAGLLGCMIIFLHKSQVTND